MFSETEKRLLFERVKNEDGVFLNGIYGEIKLMLIESNHYSKVSDINKYLKFWSKMKRLSKLQDKFFYDSISDSIEVDDECRYTVVVGNATVLFILFLVMIVLYLPFIREKREMIHHEDAVYKLVNSSSRQESSSS